MLLYILIDYLFKILDTAVDLPLEVQADGDEMRLRVALVGELRHVGLHVVHQRQHQLRVTARQAYLVYNANEKCHSLD